MFFGSLKGHVDSEQRQMHREIDRLHNKLKSALKEIMQYDNDVKNHITIILELIKKQLLKIESLLPSHNPITMKAIVDVNSRLTAMERLISLWTEHNHIEIIQNLRANTIEISRRFMHIVASDADFKVAELVKEYEVVLACLRDLDNTEGDITRAEIYTHQASQLVDRRVRGAA